MILALILLFIVILFLAVIIASALSGPGGRSPKAVSAPECPPRPQRRALASQRPTRAAVERGSYQMEAELAGAQVNYFRAVGRTNLEANGETASFEEVFTSGNEPFTGGGRNNGDRGFCFLTGQRQATCQCGECINWRARR